MQRRRKGLRCRTFPNVVPLENRPADSELQVDTPDTAPPADAAEQGLTQTKTGEERRVPARKPGKKAGLRNR